MSELLVEPTPSGAPEGVARVMAFAAHPDDIDFGAAGTVARWVRAGIEVRYVVMTRGDAGGFEEEGQAEISERRLEEQRAAGAAVGVHEVEVWAEPDGALAPSARLEEAVVAALRGFAPQLVLAPHPERDYERLQRSHPDHLACGEIVTRAVYPALENPFAYPALQASGLLAYKLEHLWFFGSPDARENTAVEVTGEWEAKLAALRSHLSQHPDVAKMQRFVASQCEAVAARAGLAPSTAAEAFHAVRVNSPQTIAGF